MAGWLAARAGGAQRAGGREAGGTNAQTLTLFIQTYDVMRAVLACILLAAANAALSRVRIDPLTRRFVDSSDRTLAFHGMNAVYKKFPVSMVVK